MPRRSISLRDQSIGPKVMYRSREPKVRTMR